MGQPAVEGAGVAGDEPTGELASRSGTGSSASLLLLTDWYLMASLDSSQARPGAG